MDSLKPTPSDIVPNADGVERPGDHHRVGRRKVLREPLQFAQNVDLGSVSNEQSFQDMQVLAKEYVKRIESAFEGKEVLFDENFLQQVADFINGDFNFTLQGSGVATLPKQLETYQNSRRNLGKRQPTSEEKRELRKLLDCKLATVMTGLVLSEVAKKRNVQMEVDIASIQPQDPHPRLKVTLFQEQGKKIYSVDFHVQLGKNETTGETYDPNEDWDGAQDHSESVATVLEIRPAILEAFDKKYPTQSLLFNTALSDQTQLATKTLQELDSRFLRA